MTDNATAAPPRVAARRFSESLHALVDPDLRAFVLGLAVEEAGGRYRAKEGETIRTLLEGAAAEVYARDIAEYEKIIKAGRKEMRRRSQAGRRAA